MLTNTEYRAMLESGVDAGLIALVESAYRIMFEAGGKTVSNSLKPLPLDVVTHLLGIDISDCTGPEGKVNWNAVSRKLYEDRRFTAVDMKVNAIVRRALDISGIKYVDEMGSPVYAYPRLNKNSELTNIEENLKNGLKLSLVNRFCRVSDPQEFVSRIDAISVEGAARALSTSYLKEVREQISKEREFSIGEHPVGDSPESEYLDGELPEPDGRRFGGSESVVLTNEDGTIWCKDGDDEYVYNLMVGYMICVTLELNPDREITAYFIYSHDAPRARKPSNSEIVHDIVNLYVSLRGTGAINGIDIRRAVDYRCANNDRNKGLAEANHFLALNISVADAVRLLKLEDSYRRSIWEAGSGNGRTLTVTDTYVLEFLSKCVDAELLDADDLAEWAEHSYDLDWIKSNADPRILMYAKKYLHGTDEELASWFGHLMTYADEVIPALTGKSRETPLAGLDFSGMPDRLDPYTFTGNLNINLLRNPKVQVEIIRRSCPATFLDLMKQAMQEFRYVPLSKEAIDFMLMNAEPNDRANVAGDIIHYYWLLVSHRGLAARMDTRARRMLFDEVNRNIDRRIRSIANTFNDLGEMASLAKHVPGFEMPERYDNRIPRTLVHLKSYRGAVSAPHFLRILTRAAYSGSEKAEQLNLFMELCLGEPICKEYEARSPIGRKIRTMFMSYAAAEHHLEEGEKGTPRGLAKLEPFGLGNLMESFATSNGDGPDDIVKFFSVYMNGKDADVSRLYAVKSEHIKKFGYMYIQTVASLLETFAYIFDQDEMLAISAFFGPKGGLLSCNTVEYVEVPGATGKKGNRRPVQKNEIRVRLVLAGALNHLIMDGNNRDLKPFMYIVNECLAGQHLILTPDAGEDDMVGTLLYLSGIYDNFERAADGGEQTAKKNIVDAEDLDSLIVNSPAKLLKYVRSMPTTLASKLCHQYFTTENVKRMSRTKDGIKLFLDIAEIGQMGDAEWDNFAAAFAAGNANNIKNLLKSLPPEEGGRLMGRLEKYLNAANRSTSSKFTAVSGSEVNSRLGSTVDYSMANGLRWMKGFVTVGQPAAMSEDGKAGLYSREDAAKFGNVVDDWRLPTADEILHLGDNPDTISEEALGFTGTGMADADGELLSGSEDFCFAWCMGPDGPIGYSVDSNNVIELNDSNIEPDFKLAMKLVR